MGIGAQSPYWRRALFRLFASTYFRRKCRTDDGVFEAYISPGSSLRFLDLRRSLVDRVHQRFICDWIEPDAIVWDIGSNLGLFALPAALKAKRGRVFAFEPDVDLAANLLRSLRLKRNKDLHVSVLCVAISNVDATACFQISEFSRAMSKLEAAGKRDDNKVISEERRSVVTMRIDSLSETLAPPTVIKIDVEGAEVMVLEGGEATIIKCRPTILVEAQKALRQPLKTFFEKHDYMLLDGRSADLSPLRNPVFDTVAVPKEKFAKRKFLLASQAGLDALLKPTTPPNQLR
jgi:FkbM family methyltransferase